MIFRWNHYENTFLCKQGATTADVIAYASLFMIRNSLSVAYRFDMRIVETGYLTSACVCAVLFFPAMKCCLQFTIASIS